ncbi:MAG: Allophanate hydrolase 2 subunit 2 [uncultured Nocardioidaceae bacterium]|uniref:Allophanate hydrolase 2 subunit 2 n=1 Tax=uncultured Nocardioidaceae bacterium TaxID=253824 RepID=A0A6J4MPE6_9ACTN|nr:MAG: Allophanate hydrolase 2 subunit 2 [uncultured Nocardioidaceae bacterium]
MTGRLVTVVDPGPLTTVQDRGRPGWAHLGVPRSGALDQPAASLGNRLVGNEETDAVLEAMVGGLALEVSTAMTAAVTGAHAVVEVDGRRQAFGEPVSVRGGQTLRIAGLHWGLRCYVALAGGVDVPVVLGSRATDTLSGIGPAPLAAGDQLPIGPPRGRPRGSDVDVSAPPPSPVTLRVGRGPRDDWFSGAALETLSRATYTVSADSNRIGLRLDGPALERARVEELPSEGIVLGAVQVPAAGTPLVFLNDHPTTGGYPVLGVVDPHDLPACAQLSPGDRVRLRA